MQEVTIRLRFTRPCLGYAQQRTNSGNVMYKIPRDPAGRVMFLKTWWRTQIEYAAKVLSRYQELVKGIDWDTVVDGRVQTYKRNVPRTRSDGTVKSTGYALHEAFRPGEEIGVNAVLPDGLDVAAFTELLTIVGRYRGISPYRSDEDNYGTFDVISVRPTIRVPVEVVQ